MKQNTLIKQASIPEGKTAFIRLNIIHVNIIAIVCIILLTLLWATVVFDIDPRVVANWVE